MIAQVGDGLDAAAHQVDVGEPQRPGDPEQVVAALGRHVHVAAVAARGGGDEEHRLRLDEGAELVVDLFEDLGHQLICPVATRMRTVLPSKTR
jgi:hypothetical protein